MMKLTINDCPKTRTAFVEKWKNDYVFRSKAKMAGFSVVMENVIFPNGKVATPKVS